MSPAWIDDSSLAEVESLLRECQVLRADESLQGLASAGEGNMNVTLRAHLHGRGTTRTVIVKQSRPFVAKYQHIEAPLERIEVESAFYGFVERHVSLAERMPRRLAWIPAHFLLVLEDLGDTKDATSWYGEAPADLDQHVRALLSWICQLHEISREEVDRVKFRNRNLRALNHAHIFDIPFRDPSEIPLNDVQAGLDSATLEVRRNPELRRRALRLGQRYSEDGSTLLHGDYYPGSWLPTQAGTRIIDPEFCFAGPAEFDLGIMLAHLRLVDLTRTETIYRDWVSALPSSPGMELVEEFAAIEVLRRLLGVAQLPLHIGLEQRMSLVERSQDVLLT